LNADTPVEVKIKVMWIVARDWQGKRMLSDKWSESNDKQNQYEAAAKPAGSRTGRLKIEGRWKKAVRRLIFKKRLVVGWPKLGKTNTP